MALRSGISIINFFLALVLTILIVSTIVYSQTSGNITVIPGQNITLDNSKVLTETDSTIPVVLIPPVAPVVVSHGSATTSTDNSPSVSIATASNTPATNVSSVVILPVAVAPVPTSTASSIVVIPAVIVPSAVIVNDATSTVPSTTTSTTRTTTSPTTTTTTTPTTTTTTAETSTSLATVNAVIPVILPVVVVNSTSVAATTLAPSTEEPSTVTEANVTVIPVFLANSFVPVNVTNQTVVLTDAAPISFREPRVEVATVETVVPVASVGMLPPAGWQPIAPVGIPNHVEDYHNNRRARYNSAESQCGSSLLLASVFVVAYHVF